jgi:hypothetical protein
MTLPKSQSCIDTTLSKKYLKQIEYLPMIANW